MSTTTLGRVNLSAIKQKAERTKTEYPAIAEPRAVELATLILQLSDEADAINANLEINKADLRSLAVVEYFQRHAGRAEVPSSMAVRADGREVLVSMTSRYKQPSDLPTLTAILGDSADRYLRTSFELKIDSAKIPADKQQAVVDRLVAVLTEFGCADALSAKEGIAPTDEFHVARHTLFTPEANMAIENVMPMMVAVKTKGRKT